MMNLIPEISPPSLIANPVYILHICTHASQRYRKNPSPGWTEGSSQSGELKMQPFLSVSRTPSQDSRPVSKPVDSINNSPAYYDRGPSSTQELLKARAYNAGFCWTYNPMRHGPGVGSRKVALPNGKKIIMNLFLENDFVSNSVRRATRWVYRKSSGQLSFSSSFYIIIIIIFYVVFKAHLCISLYGR